jgi:hypothetical protein
MDGKEAAIIIPVFIVGEGTDHSLAKSLWNTRKLQLWHRKPAIGFHLFLDYGSSLETWDLLVFHIPSREILFGWNSSMNACLGLMNRSFETLLPTSFSSRNSWFLTGLYLPGKETRFGMKQRNERKQDLEWNKGTKGNKIRNWMLKWFTNAFQFLTRGITAVIEALRRLRQVHARSMDESPLPWVSNGNKRLFGWNLS